MKKYLACLSIILCCTLLEAQGDCQRYKTGNFILVDGKTGEISNIERTEYYQIESNQNTGKIIRFAINWMSDCEYELSVIDGSSDLVNFFRGKKLIVKLLEIYADGYRFEGHIKGMNNFRTSVMKVAH